MSGTGEPVTHWFEEQPERLAWELQQLEALGLKVVEQRGCDNGDDPELLVIKTELQLRGQPVPIDVVFPFEYPDRPPSPYGPPGSLTRHQNPRSGSLCWTDNEDRTWRTSMSAAEVLDRVQQLFDDSADGEDAVRLGEADMPEPVTGLLLPGTATVVVPEPFFAHDLPTGSGLMSLLKDNAYHFLLRADGIGAADPALAARFIPTGEAGDPGAWVDLDLAATVLVLEDSSRLLALLETEAPDEIKRLKQYLAAPPPPRRHGRARKNTNKRIRQPKRPTSCWIGLTFLEEGPTRGHRRRNWLFTRLVRTSGTFALEGRADAQALTRDERSRRTPELIGLGEVRVVLVGAGSLGAPVAQELSKAGIGRLDVLDFDTYDVNNAVRHPLPPKLAGTPKAAAVATQAQHLNPFIEVRPHILAVGSSPTARADLDALVAEADLVIDTTGSAVAARILQRHARVHGKPALFVGLTAGSHGGDLLAARPGGPCYTCFQLAAEDDLIPSPPAAPPSFGVTPVGCAHPAFSGAGFDATQLASEAARIAVGLLGVSRYPVEDLNWVVVAFRGDGPHRQTGSLDPHSECPHCWP